MSFLQARADKYSVACIRAKSTEPFGVFDGLDVIDKLQIRKIVHIDLVFKNHHDSISSQFYCLYFGTEAEFSNAPVLMIVPDHNFVRRESRVSASANEGKNVATEQHLNVSDAALVEIFKMSLFEWVAVVNPKAGVSATRKASVVLIESDEQEFVGGLVLQVHLCFAEGTSSR
mmetsp:Transcript_23786/g.57654  ORF Transcript_23786/g.57654 Transcript_23786/m.57654 type:complete len:173 (+) Transcript_23786:775-1293(+)